jgi:hypothetical protein
MTQNSDREVNITWRRPTPKQDKKSPAEAGLPTLEDLGIDGQRHINFAARL